MGYCTVEQFVQWGGFGALGEAGEAEAERVIDSAAEQIDGYCGRTFTVAGTATARLFDVRAGDVVLFVDDFTGALGTVLDDQGAAVTGVEVVSTRTPGRPSSMLRYPAGVRRRGQWSVTAAWGWAATPDAVAQANLMLAHKLWQRRLSPAGIQGSVDAGFIRVHGIDRDIEALLNPFVRLQGGFG